MLLYTIHTSALYIFISPELTLDQFSTPLMPHSVLECSANGPVFTCGQRKHINSHIYNMDLEHNDQNFYSHYKYRIQWTYSNGNVLSQTAALGSSDM